MMNLLKWEDTARKPEKVSDRIKWSSVQVPGTTRNLPKVPHPDQVLSVTAVKYTKVWVFAYYGGG